MQDKQTDELFHVLDILESKMKEDPLLHSYDIIEVDNAEHIANNIFSRYIIKEMHTVTYPNACLDHEQKVLGRQAL